MKPRKNKTAKCDRKVVFTLAEYVIQPEGTEVEVASGEVIKWSFRRGKFVRPGRHGARNTPRFNK